jgi:ribosomal protein S18 acetylase RimI-like enzyme
MLDNPVFHALSSGDAHLALGHGPLKYFDEAVSPFVGIQTGYTEGFQELRNIFPAERMILHATRLKISIPARWHLMNEVSGLQFVYAGSHEDHEIHIPLVLLQKEHAAEMVQLAKLTRPGPFDMRTIEFGHYYGIFQDGKLAAMTGQRLHPGNFAEVSAVCTHPHFLGKGYAATLIKHQLNLIRRENKIPFLHVKDDNQRAIELYERLGFVKNGQMNFYFLK